MLIRVPRLALHMNPLLFLGGFLVASPAFVLEYMPRSSGNGGPGE
jgi:hypothetical protein